MKQIFLGTILGSYALKLRTIFDNLIGIINNKENISCLVNDELASFLMIRLCQENKTFLDIGSHIGSVISEVKRNDSSIKIIGIEATPEKAKKLFNKFPDIEIHDCAVGDKNGEITFYSLHNKSGYNSINKPDITKNGDYDEIKVPIKCLDDIISSTDIDFIKIDIEGAELLALKGGNRIINSNRPVIMFESAFSNDLTVKAEIWEWFNERSYELFIPNRLAHTGPPLGLETFIDSHYYPRRTQNYFAVPKERRNDVRIRAGKILGLN